MAAKQIPLHDVVRTRVAAGAHDFANAVKATLKQKGGNVVFASSFGAPTVTKNSVSVVKQIKPNERFENMGAQMVKQVARTLPTFPGHSTTTAPDRGKSSAQLH